MDAFHIGLVGNHCCSDEKYLIGMTIVKSGMVKSGFCGMLFRKYGLVLFKCTSMKPILSSEEPYVYLEFRHILCYKCSEELYEGSYYPDSKLSYEEGE